MIRNGTVGETWYDLRNDRPGYAALTADVWFAHSRDGASWRWTHAAGPIDLRTRALARQNRVGEYQRLPAMHDRLRRDSMLPTAYANDGRTDIFYARIGPGSCDPYHGCY